MARKTFEIMIGTRVFTGSTMPARKAANLLPRLLRMVGRGVATTDFNISETMTRAALSGVALKAFAGIASSLDEKELDALLKELLSGVLGTSEEGYGDCWGKFDDIFDSGVSEAYELAFNVIKENFPDLFAEGSRIANIMKQLKMKQPKPE